MWGWTVDNFQLSETVLRGRGGEPEGRTAAQVECEPTAGVLQGALSQVHYSAHQAVFFLPVRTTPQLRSLSDFQGLPVRLRPLQRGRDAAQSRYPVLSCCNVHERYHTDEWR